MSLAPQSKLRASEAGFTLIEMLIVMAILVFISFGIYQATVDTFRLQDALTTEGTFYNSIRLAMSIVQRDVTLIFSPVQHSNANPYFDPTTSNITTIAPTTATNNPGAVSNFWSMTLDVTGIRPSRFMGQENKMSFIALAHMRMYRDTPESEFAKITYELKADPSVKGSTTSYMLTKTESYDAFNMDDVRDPLSKTYIILKGIKTLTFSYYRRDGQTWKTLRQWDTEREESHNIFPDFIELTLEAIGPKNLTFEGKFRFRPEIPFYGIPAKF